MVIEQFDGDIGVGQQLHIIMQLARRDRARPFFLHLGIAGSSTDGRTGCERRLQTRFCRAEGPALSAGALGIGRQSGSDVAARDYYGTR